MSEQQKDYYKKVAEYYDMDAHLGFEEKAYDNIILKKIRNDFRKITIEYSFSNALEIGCGPGFDIAWFAQNYPDKGFTAVDISPEMIKLTKNRLQKANLNNAKALVLDERT
jgi:ubiquinone/menaquinone biosynthesis C-methylase UbiE